MTTDLMILAMYFLILAISDKPRRLTCSIVLIWFIACVVISSFGLNAKIVFTSQWLFTGVTCVLLAVRCAPMLLIGMVAMFLFTLAMSVDAWLISEPTPLYIHHSTLALIMNIVIMLLMLMHGKGLESVPDSNSNIDHRDGRCD